MKDLQTGDLSGPPLEHNEWIESTAEAHAQEEKDKAKARRPSPSSFQRTVTKSDDLESLTVAELKDRAKDAGVEHFSQLNKADLVAVLSK